MERYTEVGPQSLRWMRMLLKCRRRLLTFECRGLLVRRYTRCICKVLNTPVCFWHTYSISDLGLNLFFYTHIFAWLTVAGDQLFSCLPQCPRWEVEYQPPKWTIPIFQHQSLLAFLSERWQLCIGLACFSQSESKWLHKLVECFDLLQFMPCIFAHGIN